MEDGSHFWKNVIWEEAMEAILGVLSIASFREASSVLIVVQVEAHTQQQHAMTSINAAYLHQEDFAILRCTSFQMPTNTATEEAALLKILLILVVLRTILH